MLTATIKILLVEDNPGDALLVRVLLEEAGTDRFDVKDVGRLGEAIERLAEEDFSVVLLDLSLPDSQGLDTVEQVRTAAPRAPIVVLSGLDERRRRYRLCRAGRRTTWSRARGTAT